MIEPCIRLGELFAEAGSDLLRVPTAPLCLLAANAETEGLPDNFDMSQEGQAVPVELLARMAVANFLGITTDDIPLWMSVSVTEDVHLRIPPDCQPNVIVVGVRLVPRTPIHESLLVLIGCCHATEQKAKPVSSLIPLIHERVLVEVRGYELEVVGLGAPPDRLAPPDDLLERLTDHRDVPAAVHALNFAIAGRMALAKAMGVDTLPPGFIVRVVEDENATLPTYPDDPPGAVIVRVHAPVRRGLRGHGVAFRFIGWTSVGDPPATTPPAWLSRLPDRSSTRRGVRAMRTGTTRRNRGSAAKARALGRGPGGGRSGWRSRAAGCPGTIASLQSPCDDSGQVAPGTLRRQAQQAVGRLAAPCGWSWHLRRQRARPDDSRGRAEARFDRREWMRWSPVARRTLRIYTEWEDSEIIGALQAWPTLMVRPRPQGTGPGAGPATPAPATVSRHFKSWRSGLIRAGLKPTVAHWRYRWDDAEITEALGKWTARYGRAPKYFDSVRSAPGRPGITTVRNHFGSWQAGLTAAGLEASTRGTRHSTRASRSGTR